MKLEDLRIQHCLFMMIDIGFSKEQAERHWRGMLTMKTNNGLKIKDDSFSLELSKVQRNWRKAKETKQKNTYIEWDKAKWKH